MLKKSLYIIITSLFVFSASGITSVDFPSFPKTQETQAAYMAFSSSSTGFTFVVPNVVGHASSSPRIRVKCWGGGGGGAGGGRNTAGGAGGGGGYAESELRVLAGDELTVYVGGFGGKGINTTASGADDGGGGGGGGYSGVQRNSVFVIQCGGGGGGGSSSAAGETGGNGGAGGGGDAKPGVRGLDAGCLASTSGVGEGGFGATTAAAGAGGTACNTTTGNDGSSGSGTSGGIGGEVGSETSGGGTGGKNGGAEGGHGNSTAPGGGGGGGGAFGGGGGESAGIGEGSGGGGGGSSMALDGIFGTNTILQIGTSTTEGNEGDPFQPNNAGGGGAGGATDSTGNDGTDGAIVFIYSNGLSQVGYRFFANTDGTSVGGAAPLNSPIVAPPPGTPFRLRLLLLNNSTSSPIATNGTTTQLQFAEKVDSCDADFTGESYADIDTTTAIQFYNNATPSDNSALTPNVQDPTFHLATSTPKISYQSYEESGTFTNSQGEIGGGWMGLWDFALTYSGPPNLYTSYCIRAVQVDSQTGNRRLLEGDYLVFPEIIVVPTGEQLRLRGEVRLRNVRLL